MATALHYPASTAQSLTFSKKVFWDFLAILEYLPDPRKKGYPREGRWQIPFLKHVCKVKLLNDDGDKEMEAQQCEEQQHRQVSCQHGLHVPTVRGGGPFLDSRSVCSVGMDGCPCYLAGTATRGCSCLMET